MHMNPQYIALIKLAEELEVPFTQAGTMELSMLLAATSAKDVKQEHLSLLDNLISTMSITGNLSADHESAILTLLEGIRSRAVA
jgi:hypothetical protein